MSNKYIRAICECPIHGSINKNVCCPQYGAEEKSSAASIGLGMLMGAGFLFAIPFIAMSAENDLRNDKEDEERRAAAIQRAHDKMAALPPQDQESSIDRLYAAM